MLTNSRQFDWLPEKSREPGWLTRLHNSTCILCALHALLWLFMSIFAVGDALQSVRKFEGIRAPRPFHYYLTDGDFWVILGIFLSATAELLIYIALCQLTKKKKFVLGSIMYFSCMLVFHTIACLNDYSLILGYAPPLPVVTMLPSIVYFALYLFRVHKLSKS